MQILGEPRLRFGALQIPARFVDVECGVPCDIRLGHRTQYFLQP